MVVFHWIGRAISGAGRLVKAAFVGVLTLFSASLDIVLGIVARLYDRFDAGFTDLAAESRRRKGGKARVAAPAE